MTAGRGTAADVVRVASHEDFCSVMAAAREGQASAFRTLWIWFAPRVAAYAGRIGSREPDEVTNDVFLAVFTKVDAFEGDESDFRAFVFTIAHRRVVDELRRRYRRAETVPLPREGGSAGGVDLSAEDVALDRWGTERVRRLIEGLPSDQREVLVLRILGDLSVDQVADVLGKSVGAVRSLQERGLARLRRASPVRPTRYGGRPAMWGVR